MSSEGETFTAGLIFGGLLGFLISLGILCMADHTDSLRKQAIERGYAEYNAKTGSWQWKEPAAK